MWHTFYKGGNSEVTCLQSLFYYEWLFYYKICSNQHFCRLDEDGKVLTPEEILYRVCTGLPPIIKLLSSTNTRGDLYGVCV